MKFRSAESYNFGERMVINGVNVVKQYAKQLKLLAASELCTKWNKSLLKVSYLDTKIRPPISPTATPPRLSPSQKTPAWPREPGFATRKAGPKAAQRPNPPAHGLFSAFLGLRHLP